MVAERIIVRIGGYDPGLHRTSNPSLKYFNVLNIKSVTFRHFRVFYIGTQKEKTRYI